MKPRRVLEPRDTTAIFDRAVQERALAVLTLQDGTNWSTLKSRFLERDGNGRFFVLDYQSIDDQPLPPVSPGQYVGVSFRQKSRKILFATVVEAKGHFVQDDQQSIAAVRYRWPESLTELQRRAYYRTPVPPEMTLQASVWSGGAAQRAASQGETLQIAAGQLADLSCGGAMIQLNGPLPGNWAENDLLGVELQLPDGRAAITLDVRHRGVRQSENGQAGLAIQFVGLEMLPDGRAVLQRMAACVQKLHRLSQTHDRRDPRNKQQF